MSRSPSLLRWFGVTFVLLAGGFASSALAVPRPVGAEIPWTTIEAETMRTTGLVLGPRYGPHQLETESSGQRCVQLRRGGEKVEFAAPIAADSLVLRYHLPDALAGGGVNSALTLVVNGKSVATLALSSRNTWLYGNYPFSNDPKEGKPRNFYDELRLKQLKIAKGDLVQLQKTTDDGVPCVIDLVDLELIPAPVAQPAGSLAVTAFGARGDGQADATEALQQAVAAAAKQGGGVVWVPAGDFKISGDIVVPSGVTIQGAGMWHTTFVGDAALYGKAERRVRFKLAGTKVRLADFAIAGQLNYRNDQEPNDGVVGAGCIDASVARLWIEHTKAGVWVYNGTRLTIEGCRFRNLIADGVNFCVGTNHSVVENCTARGTGDDCFAIWPAPADQGHDEHAPKPGNNVIRRSTGQLTFLANGGAIYGGANNRIEDCLFTDIGTGCGILISSTFPTSDDARVVDNNFNGQTTVLNTQLIRCGGYDHSWAWRGSIQLCLDRRSFGGVRLTDVRIEDSLSDGLTVVAPGTAKKEGTLSDTVLKDVVIGRVGLGAPDRPAIFIRKDAVGGFTVRGGEVGQVRNESEAFKVHRP